MAERTPPNVGGFLGGFMFGRPNENRQTERAIDRLEQVVDRFADTLDKASQQLGGAAQRTSSATSTGPATQQSRLGNGGAVSFGGAHTPTSHRAAGEPSYVGGGGYAPTHRGNGGAVTFGGQSGYTPTHSAGTGAMVARNAPAIGAQAGRVGRAVGLGVVGAATAYGLGTYGDQYVRQTMAAQQSYGFNTWGAERGMFGSNYTAANFQDLVKAQGMMTQRSGFLANAAEYQSMRSGAESLSLINPSMTNTQAVQGMFGMGTLGTFNRMQAIGIDTMDRRGRIDVMSIANQILSRVPGSEAIGTPEEVEAALGATGGITVTIDDMVRNKMIPQESREAVRTAVRGILMARTRGVGYGKLTRLARTAARGGNDSAAGNAAREQLRTFGIGEGLITGTRVKEGMARDTQAETIQSFSKAVEASTNVLQDFRGALNQIMSGPLGFATGIYGGTTGTLGGSLANLPLIGGLLSKIGVGDGPANMASSAASYGGAVAAGGSGPANRSASAMSYGGAAASSGGGGGSTGSSGSRYGLGAVKPWVAKAANILGPKFGIKTIGGYRDSSAISNSDHPKGLALDFMCGKSAGDGLARYAVANHKALNITYVIWRQRIWSINNPRWQQMEDRGSVTANHFDHVHISFLASPTNADLGGLSAGNGTGGAGGAALAEGESRPDNGSAFSVGPVYGAYSEAATLGVGVGGFMSGGGGGPGMAGASAGSVQQGSGGGGGGKGNPNLSGISGGGSSAANIRLGRQMAAAYGWTGNQWQDLLQLWMKESGWRTNADNPTSSAYGIPQALTELHNLGGTSYMTDPKAQIRWGLNYIKGRYGNPSKAWDFWQSHNWYDVGEWDIRADRDAKVHKGEMILPSKVAEAVRTELTAPGIRGGRGAGGGPSIVFQPGSIVVQVQSGSNTKAAKELGSGIVDAIVEDSRIRELMSGR